MTPRERLRRIRLWLAIFVAGLVLAGLTAFPLQAEIELLVSLFGVRDAPAPGEPALHAWLRFVHRGITETYARYPFMAYGTDWLAFAHLAIAVAFVGPWRDPVRNAWVITFGLIACAGVIPLALVAGHVRGIPPWWRVIDCSFGVLGAVPLLACRRHVARLEPARVVAAARQT